MINVLPVLPFESFPADVVLFADEISSVDLKALWRNEGSSNAKLACERFEDRKAAPFKRMLLYTEVLSMFLSLFALGDCFDVAMVSFDLATVFMPTRDHTAEAFALETRTSFISSLLSIEGELEEDGILISTFLSTSESVIDFMNDFNVVKGFEHPAIVISHDRIFSMLSLNH
ncbi:hypothetical protein GQX74_014591 [Glossina fuscipes]|nr:hypothetical protein GQX74_014591 [Glossina fuscipes]